MRRPDPKWMYVIIVLAKQKTPSLNRGLEISFLAEVRRKRRSRGRRWSRLRKRFQRKLTSVFSHRIIGKHTVRDVLFHYSVHSAVASIVLALPLSVVCTAVSWAIVAVLLRR